MDPVLSIIVPAHNESELLPATIDSLRTELDGRSYEVIVVDDSSTDGTGTVADAFAERYERVTAVHRQRHPGLGNAIKWGMREADGTILSPFMGDGSDDAATLLRMADEITAGADVVYGSRFVPGGAVVGYPFRKLAANRAYNLLVRTMFGMPYRDVTNAFKAYHRRVIETIGVQNLDSDGFDITVELPVRAHLNGFAAVEVPTRWESRTAGASSHRLHAAGPRYLRRALALYRENILRA